MPHACDLFTLRSGSAVSVQTLIRVSFRIRKQKQEIKKVARNRSLTLQSPSSQPQKESGYEDVESTFNQERPVTREEPVTGEEPTYEPTYVEVADADLDHVPEDHYDKPSVS